MKSKKITKEEKFKKIAGNKKISKMKKMSPKAILNKFWKVILADALENIANGKKMDPIKHIKTSTANIEKKIKVVEKMMISDYDKKNK